MPRSRLTFEVTDGSLTPTTVSFVIKRTSDNKYWDGTTSTWGAGVVENAATGNGSGSWSYAVTGAARRQFVGVSLVVEARAKVGSATYTSQVIPTYGIR